MADTAVRDLSDKAKRALVELHDKFKARVAFADEFLIVKPAGFWQRLGDEYEQRVKEIMREGTTEVRNDRDVRVECPDCHRTGTIPGDQARWSCSCSPHIDRFAFQTYQEAR